MTTCGSPPRPEARYLIFCKPHTMPAQTLHNGIARSWKKQLSRYNAAVLRKQFATARLETIIAAFILASYHALTMKLKLLLVLSLAVSAYAQTVATPKEV